MSSSKQAEASKPQKKMQECNRCKAAGFPNQPIAFEKIGEDQTGKTLWKLIDETGVEHKHKMSGINDSFRNTGSFRKKRIVDIVSVTDVLDAKRLLLSGWDYQTSYPATIANIPHYILVRKE